MNIICHLCLILGVIVLADDSHPNWIPHRVLKHSLSLTILQAWFDDFPIHHQIIIKSFLVHLFEQGFGGDEWTIPIINLHTNTFFSPTVAQLNGCGVDMPMLSLKVRLYLQRPVAPDASKTKQFQSQTKVRGCPITQL